MNVRCTVCLAGLLPGLCTAQIFEPKDPFGEPYGPQWNFVHNEGQPHYLNGDFASDVAIQSVGTTPSLYLFRDSRTGFTYRDPATGQVSRIDLTFVGENSQGVSPGLYHPTGMKYNFYEEHTPDGVTGVQAGKSAIFENVYPLIDFHVLSNPWGPKFYIVLRPGADQHDLRLQVSGQDSLRIDYSGDLKIWFGNRFLRLKQGYAYQQIGNTIVDVPWVANYANMNGSANVTFTLGTYDPTLPLILCIKPWLPPAPPTPPALDPEWSTYFPGIDNDVIKDLAHDASGNVYFTGASNSVNGLPVAPGGVQQSELAGEFDMIVGKINPNYEITTPDTWMTYFGSGVRDHGAAIAYTSTSGGRLAVCGPSEINSSQPMAFPMGDSYTTTTGFGLLALFDPATGLRTYCTHLWSTTPGYFNNSGPADVDYDQLGNLYLVGSGYLHTNNFNNEVVDPPGSDDYTSISHINNGGYFLQDSYVARFDPEMHLTWLTALGGPMDDKAYACAIDHVNSRLIVVGETNSPNDLGHDEFPTSGLYEYPLYHPSGSYNQNLVNGNANCSTLTCGMDAFIAVFSLSNLKLLYSSYIGPGIEDDSATDVETDAQGNIYIVGWTDYHTYANTTACQWDEFSNLVPCDAGGYFDEETGPSTTNHFIRRLNEDFELTWSTFIAGEQDEYWSLVDEISRPRVDVDEFDNVYMFGSTASGAVPETDPIAPFVPNGSYYSNFAHADPTSTSPATTYDTYLLKFDPETHLVLSTLFGGDGQDYACGLTVLGPRVYVCGVTGSAIFPTHAPVIPGAAPYFVEAPSGTVGDLDAYMAQLGYDYTVGQAEPGSATGGAISAYPNPTTGELTLAGLVGDGKEIVQVLDILGRQLMPSLMVNASRISVNTGVLPPGSYLVRVNGPKGTSSCRFVKQ